MKRIIALLLSILLLAAHCSALAEDGVIVLQTPETEQETLTMDDVKSGTTYNIEGFGEVTIFDRDWNDAIGVNRSGNYEYHSGKEAEYYVLMVTVLNTQFSSVCFRKEFGDVICSYGDGYKFGGFVEELSDPPYKCSFIVELYEGTGLARSVNPMYDRDYFVIVALPNAVKTRTEPLSITFTLGENEFTYHVRK